MSLIDEKVDALTEVLKEAEVDYLERSAQYRLSDAIREGASVSDQAYSWTDTEGNLCALSAGVVAAKTRGYIG